MIFLGGHESIDRLRPIITFLRAPRPSLIFRYRIHKAAIGQTRRGTGRYAPWWPMAASGAGRQPPDFDRLRRARLRRLTRLNGRFVSRKCLLW